MPQRSRRSKTSGMDSRQPLRSRRLLASKKQTPFSVWYTPAPLFMPCSVATPQRSRRLSASGIAGRMGRSRISGPASKKQTPFSVWYDYAIQFEGGPHIMPQRSRRLSASGIGLGILKWEDIFAPQRSRRLSASGMQGGIETCQTGTAPQRSRRLSASGIPAVRRRAAGAGFASKKQTPFSVWYSRHASADVHAGIVASKKQTPFSVWYGEGGGGAAFLGECLKEADAFQRLVFSHAAQLPRYGSRLKEADAFQRLVYEGFRIAMRLLGMPQRSRRLSASGI